ncbi:N-acetylmuramoyl-L-alanine amidase [Eubacteriales bacterium OttesenSCG-928-N14]|nr:N-acetylmuramoyl-L-alanine amidase [Eubacteriales bacterium OttesenSCG-928-N14]
MSRVQSRNVRTGRRRQANGKKKNALSVILLAVAIVGIAAIAAFFLLGDSSLPALASVNGERIVIIDAGHGGVDTGTTYGEVHESDINLAIAQKLAAVLRERGYTVIVTREADEWVGLYKRNAFIHQYALNEYKRRGGDLEIQQHLDALQTVLTTNNDKDNNAFARGPMYGFGVDSQLKQIFDIERSLEGMILVSVHVNAMENSDDVFGLQIISTDASAINDSEKRDSSSGNFDGIPYHSRFKNHNDSRRAKLANSLYESITQKLPETKNPNIDGIPLRNVAILRENCLPGVIVEVGFLSNPQDRARIVTEQFQADMATAIADGVDAYFR